MNLGWNLLLLYARSLIMSLQKLPNYLRNVDWKQKKREVRTKKSSQPATNNVAKLKKQKEKRQTKNI